MNLRIRLNNKLFRIYLFIIIIKKKKTKCNKSVFFLKVSKFGLYFFRTAILPSDEENNFHPANF